MDGESEAGSIENGSNVDDEPLLQMVITDDFFTEITTKANAAIKSLQADQRIIVADEFQKVVYVCQNLRKNLCDEQSRATQLKEEINTYAERLMVTTKSLQHNEEIIKKQRKEIEDVWSERDAAQQREKTAQTQMYTMREKLDKFEADVKKSQTMGDDEPGMSLVKYKEAMKREQDRLNSEIDDLNRKINAQRLHTEEVEKKRIDFENKNKDLYKILDETSSDAFKEKRVLDQLKASLAEVTAERNAYSEQIRSYKLQYTAFKTKNIHLNMKIGAAKANLEKQMTQNQLATGKLTKAHTDIDVLAAQNDKLQMELNQESTRLKLKEVDYSRVVKENVQILKSRETLQKKLVVVETEKAASLKEVAKLKNSLITLEKTQEDNRKASLKVTKQHDEMMRERDLMRKDLKKAEDVLDDQRDVIKLQEQHLLSLDHEIKAHLLTIQQQKVQLSNAERARDRNASTSHLQLGKADAVQLELELNIKQYNDLKESFDALQIKYTHLQQQYDSLQSERNNLHQELTTTLADREIVREKLRISVSKREKLIEQLNSKASEIYRIGKQIDRLEKDKSVLRNDIQNIMVNMQHMKTELAEKCAENTGLYKTLADNEKQFIRLNKQLEGTQQRKDLMEAQLFNRTDQILNLNEKQQIMQMALERGNSQYRNRLKDISLLKIEISNLRSQKNLLSRGLANTTDMRQEVLQLIRNLTQERVKAKALEQEMMTPMNIHRWRKLTGKDPNQMDLIVKIQTLQKRILFQTASSSRKDTQLHQISLLYEAVKDAMSKMPGPTILVKLTRTQRALTARTKTLKSLSAEANAKELDGKVKEFSLQVMKRDLIDSKERLLKEKREKQKLKSEMDALRQQVGREPFSNMGTPLPVLAYKTAGAGYRIPTAYAYE